MFSKDYIISKISPTFLKGICHRGLWNEKDPENSLAAFKNAIDKNMAIEFDVHLTRTGELVVIHDSDLKRVTGKDGIVEDLSLEELKNDYKLSNGETIPTFEEVLKLVDEQIPMVIELKVYKRNYKQLSLTVRTSLFHLRNKENVILISFDPRALFPFKNFGCMRQLLVCKQHKHVYFFRRFFEGVDLEYSFLEKTRVQKYCQTHFSNVWTIENKELLKAITPYIDTVTFQKIDPDLVCKTLCDKNFPDEIPTSNKLDD